MIDKDKIHPRSRIYRIQIKDNAIKPFKRYRIDKHGYLHSKVIKHRKD